MSDSDTAAYSDLTDVLRIRKARRFSAIIVGVVILLIGLIALGFVLVKTVTINITPDRAAAKSSIVGTRGFSVALGRNVHFLGIIEVEAVADGFFPKPLQLDGKTESPISVDLVPRPGDVTIELDFLAEESADGYNLTVNGSQGFEPVPSKIELLAGTYEFRLQGPQEYDVSQTVDIIGYGKQQIVSFAAMPRGSFAVSVKPSSASIELNGTFLGEGAVHQTVVAKSHVLEFKASGYRNKRLPFSVSAGAHVDLGSVTLEGAPGTIRILSEPATASVMIDGQFMGSTPFEKDFFQPVVEFELRVPNFQAQTVTVQVLPGDTVTRQFTLQPVRFDVEVTSEPPAMLQVNSKNVATTPQTITVSAGDVLSISKDGYASHTITMASAEQQKRQIDVVLIDFEQHFFNRAPVYEDAQDSIRLKKFPGAEFQVLVPRYLTDDDRQRTRQFEISRPFYIGVHEVRRKEYAKFDASVNTSTEDENLPITDVSWVDAVTFCNWLSEQEGFEPAYRIEPGGRVTIDPESKGYRLPTEAEWELITYYDFSTNKAVGAFVWGEGTKPPTGVGNLAGFETRSALRSYISNYGDQHKDLAPVGSYRRNINGIHDLVGNASEWVYDYAGAAYEGWDQPSIDPLGPKDGIDRIVKGANFQTTKLHEAAINFRRTVGFKSPTVGFRIARWML